MLVYYLVLAFVLGTVSVARADPCKVFPEERPCTAQERGEHESAKIQANLRAIRLAAGDSDWPCKLICAPNGSVCKWCPTNGKDCGKAPGVIEGERQEAFCRPARLGPPPDYCAIMLPIPRLTAEDIAKKIVPLANDLARYKTAADNLSKYRDDSGPKFGTEEGMIYVRPWHSCINCGGHPNDFYFYMTSDEARDLLQPWLRRKIDEASCRLRQMGIEP